MVITKQEDPDTGVIAAHNNAQNNILLNADIYHAIGHEAALHDPAAQIGGQIARDTHLPDRPWQ